MTQRYAVPSEVKELEKKERAKQEDEEAIRFKQKYMNPNRVVTDIPTEVQEDSSENEQPDPQIDVGANHFSYLESFCYL